MKTIDNMDNERPAMSKTWLLSIINQLKNAMADADRGLLMYEEPDKAYLTISGALRLANAAITAMDNVVSGSVILPKLLSGDEQQRTYSNNAIVWRLDNGKFIVTSENISPPMGAELIGTLADLLER